MSEQLTVAELMRLLAKCPNDAEVCVDRGGAYSDARTVNFSVIAGETVVFISSEEE